VAVEALNAGDTSASFLCRYEERVNRHPFIIHTITDFRRWDMRRVLLTRDDREFLKKVRDHWGIGAFRYKNMGGPCLKASIEAVRKDPSVLPKWINMFGRYFKNWETNSFDRLSTDV
jgi:hypothetical protein